MLSSWTFQNFDKTFKASFWLSRLTFSFPSTTLNEAATRTSIQAVQTFNTRPLAFVVWWLCLFFELWIWCCSLLFSCRQFCTQSIAINDRNCLFTLALLPPLPPLIAIQTTYCFACRHFSVIDYSIASLRNVNKQGIDPACWCFVSFFRRRYNALLISNLASN